MDDTTLSTADRALLEKHAPVALWGWTKFKCPLIYRSNLLAIMAACREEGRQQAISETRAKPPTKETRYA